MNSKRVKILAALQAELAAAEATKAAVLPTLTEGESSMITLKPEAQAQYEAAVIALAAIGMTIGDAADLALAVDFAEEATDQWPTDECPSLEEFKTYKEDEAVDAFAADMNAALVYLVGFQGDQA